MVLGRVDERVQLLFKIYEAAVKILHHTICFSRKIYRVYARCRELLFLLHAVVYVDTRGGQINYALLLLLAIFVIPLASFSTDAQVYIVLIVALSQAVATRALDATV